jgi:mRNA-degrading endonuclease toxin of MazEF toxin-antitoxin module
MNSKPDARVFCQWEIWDVQWEHKDDGTAKPRPVLILSSTAHNSQSDKVWVIKISSVKHEARFVFELNPLDPAAAGTGLKKTSYFYLTTLREIPKTTILKERPRGRLNPISQFAIRFLVKQATGKDW